MPRWRGLNHFESVMNITFNDGSKNRDISKVFLFAAYDCLPKDKDESGYLLLRCLRSYLNVRMFTDFDLHTETTISAGRQELNEIFAKLMQKYIKSIQGEETASMEEALDEDENIGDNDEEASNEDSDSSDGDGNSSDEQAPNAGNDNGDAPKIKNWNIPKKHIRKHLFDNIEDKGVSRNSGTKVNEGMHGPLKTSYHDHTNFKHFVEQILKADHHLMVSGLIRSNINALDCYLESFYADPEDGSATAHSIIALDAETGKFDSSEYDQVRQLGSQIKPCSFGELEGAHQRDSAFGGFRIKLGKFLTNFLPLYGVHLSGDVKFRPSDLVTEYRFLKVKYNCLADWQLKTDYLRCNPSFHGHPRFDCVLVDCLPHPYIARLVGLFTCVVDNQEYPIALVQPHSPNPTGLSRSQKETDADLEFHRVRENARSKCEFISIHTIIRGVVLSYTDEVASNGLPSHDYFLFDYLDSDMFLRGRELLQQRQSI